MAINDMVGSIEQVSSGAFMDILTTTNQAYMVFNISADNTKELYRSNGTLSILIDSLTSSVGGWAGFKWLVNDTNYLRVKNTADSTSVMQWDGVRIT